MMLQLEFLRLDFNLIETIESFSFADSRLLTELNLSNNRLSCLNEYAFAGGLFQLKVLGWSFNSIDFISHNMLADLSNLLTLKLNDNLIRFIENYSFINLKSSRF